jgi:hypothetical protein
MAQLMNESAVKLEADSKIVNHPNSVSNGFEGASFEGLQATGPAFTLLIKLLATILVVAVIFWGVQASRILDWHAFSLSAALMWATALAIVLVVYYWILKSRTSIKNGVIEQTWVWKKRVSIVDIRQAKFIYLPALSWLIAPRLIVRAGPVMSVFYTADPGVQRAFAALMLGR